MSVQPTPLLLWRPTPAQVQQTQMQQFWSHIEQKYGYRFSDYRALHAWSVRHPENFWAEMWAFCGIVADTAGSTICDDRANMEGATWFPDAKLNFSDNLLRINDNSTALVGLSEFGDRRTLSYLELNQHVNAMSAALLAADVTVGDRVAGFMPNIIETVVAMLACARVGAVWTSCSSDFGVNAACDRFAQVEPKVMFTSDGYCYNAKIIDSVAKARQLCEDIASIQRLIVVPFIGTSRSLHAIDEPSVTRGSPLDNNARGNFEESCYSALLNHYMGETVPAVPLPFNHPLYILYSSGTTGKPKCIVHSAGGTLLQHRKEHLLHTNLTLDDVFFYFTTCGWMMWNWLVSGLASGCTIVLYDGSPFAKDGDVLLDAIETEKISIFGVGAKYLDALEKAGKTPHRSHNVDSLRTILSTGSPLSRHSFEWIYRSFKRDLCLSSISGGTDIVSCFVLGNPLLPVYAGEIQCLGLGMDVAIWDQDGASLVAQKGELVCTTAFPSAPIGFWNDESGDRYHQAYFARYPNVWAHGDYGEITERGTVIIHGRSDAVLNPGGVRIGTAEIYRQVETITDIMDSVVVGQQWGEDERVVLFVVLREEVLLTEALTDRIRETIRGNATPRHVPAVIIAVADIPRTMSGKVSEIAVKKTIHGLSVENADALANPASLVYFRHHPALA